MPEVPDPATWDEPEMHRFLAVHNISEVYRLLCATGMKQRDIAELVGQTQSEVTEILKGRRVLAYDVLQRIADGLGIPYGHMGLAYADAEGNLVVYPRESGEGNHDPALEDDEMISRRVLGMAAGALLGDAILDGSIMQRGAPLFEKSGGLPLVNGSHESLDTLSKDDVPWIRALTDRLWTLDLEYGGASIFAAARGAAVQVVGALRNSPPNRELQLAASNLCRVTAWSAFDAGLKRVFWQYHATALDLARESGDMPTIVTMVNVAGRAEILSGNHRAAAKLFELVSFRKAPDAVGWGLLGSAYAPHSPESARRTLVRLRDAEGADTLDAMAMLGHVSNDVGDYQDAIAAFTEVVPHRSGRLALQETAPLAIAYLKTGEISAGLHHAENALKLSENILSSKCKNVLRPLGAVLAAQQDSTAQDLAHRVAAVVSA